MTSLFISYSRKDIEFARRLTESFKGQGLDFWIDWEGIPPTVDWWKEIEKGIEEADIFLFLISPDSSKSKVCKQEIEHAVRNGKRLIPLVVRDVSGNEVPVELSTLNWLFLRGGDDFEPALSRLMTAIHTDFEWVQAHRQLQVKALEWERNNRENSFLLRGKELSDAEFELATNTSKEPHPTDLQRAYVFSSRRESDRQRRFVTIGIAIIAFALLGLGIFATVKAVDATNQAATAQSAQSTAQANADEVLRQATINSAIQLAALAQAKSSTNLDLSLLLSIEAWQKNDNLRTRSALLDSLMVSPHLYRFVFSKPSASLGTGTTGLAFSPDGKILVVANCGEPASPEYFCLSTRFELWSLDTGHLIGGPAIQPITADGYTTPNMNPIIFSPDSRVVALGTNDVTLGFLQIGTQQHIYQPFLFGGGNIALTPDGQTVAISSCDPGLYDPRSYCPKGDRIILLNFETREPMGEPLQVDQMLFSRLAFSTDGKILVSAGCTSTLSSLCSSNDTDIVRWDVKTRQTVGEPIQIMGQVAGLSPDGTTLVTTKNVYQNLLWDLSTENQIGQTIEGVFAGFSQDSKVFAIQDTGGRKGVTLWRTQSGERLDQEPREIPIAFNPNGQTFATIENETTIVLWDSNSGQRIDSLPSGSTSALTALTFNPGGTMIAAGNMEGKIILLDLSVVSPITQTFVSSNADILNLLVDPSENILIAFEADGTVNQWQVKSMQKTSQRYTSSNMDYFFSFGHPAYTHCLEWVANQAYCIRSEFAFRNMATGGPAGKAHIVSGNVEAVSPDGRILVTTQCQETEEIVCVSEDIIMQDIERDRPIGPSLETDFLYANKFAFNSTGDRLASVGCVSMLGSLGLGCAQSELVIWDVKTHRIISQAVLDFDRSAYELTFDPTDQILAISDERGGSFILWDINKQKPIGQSLDGPSLVMTFSPDSRILATGGCRKDENPLLNGEIILWDVSTRQPIGRPLHGHAGCVSSLVFSPDGKTLWSASYDDSTILQWNLDVQTWVEYACDRVGRNLTPTEWGNYFPDQPYPLSQIESTCSQWPLETNPDMANSSTNTITATPLPTFSITPSPLPVFSAVTLTPCPTSSMQAAGSLVNINTATQAELESLPGIGPTTAQRIIEYRTTNGSFTAIEDLMNVTGISSLTFDYIKDLITVSCV